MASLAENLGWLGKKKLEGNDRHQNPSAKQLLASGSEPKDEAHDLGVYVPTLYRWIPASTRTT